MIPKIIHYCWFGVDKNGNKNPKSKLILDCIDSWNENLKGYELKEWSEDNFEYNNYEYSKNAYINKKWAFVSDYTRLKILYEHGGIYLDTDMYVLKSFDDFLNHELVLGKEDELHISAGMIACAPRNEFIKKCIEYYDKHPNELITIPRILTRVYNENKSDMNNVKVFESEYFYPFDANNINKFNFKNAPKLSYAVHMWNYSWGHPAVKLVKKIGIHKLIVRILDRLKIKNLIKKILGTA